MIIDALFQFAWIAFGLATTINLVRDYDDLTPWGRTFWLFIATGFIFFAVRTLEVSP